MTLFGIEFKQPSFWRFTRAVVIAIILFIIWAMIRAVGDVPTTEAGGAAYLAALLTGTVFQSMGVNAIQGKKQCAIVVFVGLLAAGLMYVIVASVG
jgi:hypothetical protein